MPPVIDGMKECANPECPDENPKPVSEFFSERSRSSGVSSRCKACTLRQRDNEDFRQRRRSYERDRYKSTPRKEQIRRYGRLRRYGLSHEDFEALLAAQGGRCAIDGCDRGADYVDHDHVTGKVRGILCPPHNTALGFLGDNLEGVLAAAAYLRRAA